VGGGQNTHKSRKHTSLQSNPLGGLEPSMAAPSSKALASTLDHDYDIKELCIHNRPVDKTFGVLPQYV
jgi:hypothetical protein